MQNKNTLSYLALIGIHIVIGFAIFILPFLAKVYAFLIIVVGIIVLLKSRNNNNEALFLAAYLVGAEVLLRMKDGVPLYEFGKYGVMFFLLLGMIYQGFSKGAFIYWLFIVVLLPGVFYSFFTLSSDTNIRKAILFNISGPLTLAVTAIYCFKRQIALKDLNNVILAIGLPILSLLFYLFFYAPSIKEVVTGTNSNFATSGGFGPNQVSTVLGLGAFVFLSRALLVSSFKRFILLNILISSLLIYRGIVTFSRGGMITAFVMIICLMLVLYLKSSAKGKVKLGMAFSLVLGLVFSVWIYSSSQTGGLIDKRYSNQDATGRVKKDRLGGREEVTEAELKIFLDNPILGVGVGKNIEIKEEMLGQTVAAHSEISRMFAEHGLLGIIGLLILIFTPIFLGLNNKQNIYLYSFFLFWLLTINHAAMRIAAPGFIYGLSLLKVRFEENSVHRE
jgi:hypothetical protein